MNVKKIWAAAFAATMLGWLVLICVGFSRRPQNNNHRAAVNITEPIYQCTGSHGLTSLTTTVVGEEFECFLGGWFPCPAMTRCEVASRPNMGVRGMSSTIPLVGATAPAELELEGGRVYTLTNFDQNPSGAAP